MHNPEKLSHEVMLGGWLGREDDFWLWILGPDTVKLYSYRDRAEVLDFKLNGLIFPD